MGFEAIEKYRSEFPIRDHLIYMNHAGVAPLSRRAADAMKHLADDALEFGSFHYDAWLATYDGVRTAAARLINADPAEIALVKNTSEGISFIATGLKWSPGDRIVAFHEEFPANQYPWRKLEEAGVAVE